MCRFVTCLQFQNLVCPRRLPIASRWMLTVAKFTAGGSSSISSLMSVCICTELNAGGWTLHAEFVCVCERERWLKQGEFACCYLFAFVLILTFTRYCRWMGDGRGMAIKLEQVGRNLRKWLFFWLWLYSDLGMLRFEPFCTKVHAWLRRVCICLLFVE